MISSISSTSWFSFEGASFSIKGSVWKSLSKSSSFSSSIISSMFSSEAWFSILELSSISSSSSSKISWKGDFSSDGVSTISGSITSSTSLISSWCSFSGSFWVSSKWEKSSVEFSFEISDTL